MVYVESPHMLSSFQRWALIYLHNKEGNSTAMQILKDCCITAMDDRFEKKDVTEGLHKLKEMKLISLVDNPDEVTLVALGQVKGELSSQYIITADGIIYTKKMLKPVLTLIDKGGIETIAQKLDAKTGSWITKLINQAHELTQQQIVQEIAKYGLGNIDGLSNLLEGIRNISS